MGQNYHDGKYALFVSFYGDLESKRVIWELNKKHAVDKYTKESSGIASFLLQVDSI